MELMAMKEMLMQMGKHSYLYESPPMGQAIPQDKDHHFHLRDSATNSPGLHGHDFTLTKTEFETCMNGTDVSVTTSYNLAHQHELTVYCRKDNGNVYYRKCDGLDACWDKHSHSIIALRDYKKYPFTPFGTRDSGSLELHDSPNVFLNNQ